MFYAPKTQQQRPLVFMYFYRCKFQISSICPFCVFSAYPAQCDRSHDSMRLAPLFPKTWWIWHEEISKTCGRNQRQSPGFLPRITQYILLEEKYTLWFQPNCWSYFNQCSCCKLTFTHCSWPCMLVKVTEVLFANEPVMERIRSMFRCFSKNYTAIFFSNCNPSTSNFTNSAQPIPKHNRPSTIHHVHQAHVCCWRLCFTVTINITLTRIFTAAVWMEPNHCL